MPNAKRLDPREIIAEIQHLGGEVEQRVARIYELSETLYGSIRHGHFRHERDRLEQDLRLVHARLDRAIQREEPHEQIRQLQEAERAIERQLDAHGDIVPVYTLFANSWKRFAGTIHQGLRRAASVDRVVVQVQQKHGVSEIVEAASQPAPAPAQPGMGVEELVELYGEETVNAHASE